MFQTGRPQNPLPLGDFIGSKVIASTGDKTLQAGFAYVTLAGLAALRKTRTGNEWLSGIRSEWVVSIDQGITEPAALDTLLALPDASARLYLPLAELSPRTLFATPKFHAKVLRLRVGHPQRSVLLWAGSANATGGALGSSAKNFEAGISVVDPASLSGDDSAFDAWWNEVWTASRPLTTTIVRKYARVREKALRKNPILLETMESSSSEAVTKATVLWMDVGSASGGSRNQVEFTETLAAFFGPPTKGLRFVEIVRKRRVFTDRPLAYRKWHYVDIWRLGLPTGYSYPRKRVKLTRLLTRPGGNPRFQLEIASLASSKAKSWFREANKRGHVERTRGTSATRPAREYGYY